MDLQTFLLYALITVLMTPLLLVYGIPFILAAKLFNHIAKRWAKDSIRLIAACGIAALGIAPAYDIYRAPLPIYVHLLQGDGVGAGLMLVSFAVTWALVVLQVRLLLRKRAKRQQG